MTTFKRGFVVVEGEGGFVSHTQEFTSKNISLLDLEVVDDIFEIRMKSSVGNAAGTLFLSQADAEELAHRILFMAGKQ